MKLVYEYFSQFLRSLFAKIIIMFIFYEAGFNKNLQSISDNAYESSL